MVSDVNIGVKTSNDITGPRRDAGYVKTRENRVIRTATHFALREWRAEMAKPATLPVLVGVAVLLTIIGPFDTDARLRTVPRFAYWLAMAAITYSIGIIVSAVIQHMAKGMSHWPRLALTALCIGVCVTGGVLMLNLAVFGVWPTGYALWASVANVMAIAVVITYLLSLQPDAAPVDATPAPPVLQDRLPLDKRGAILSLTVEDHYTRVRTTKGEHLLLMRLSDAIKEMGDTPGAQVHRSHWAAWDHVSAARRDGDRAILTLSDDSEIPVSRSNLSKIKDAGLLPK